MPPAPDLHLYQAMQHATHPPCPCRSARFRRLSSRASRPSGVPAKASAAKRRSPFLLSTVLRCTRLLLALVDRDRRPAELSTDRLRPSRVPNGAAPGKVFRASSVAIAFSDQLVDATSCKKGDESAVQLASSEDAPGAPSKRCAICAQVKDTRRLRRGLGQVAALQQPPPLYQLCVRQRMLCRRLCLARNRARQRMRLHGGTGIYPAARPAAARVL